MNKSNPPVDWSELANFERAEFDSPDAPNSGDNMQPEFMQMLQDARTIAGVPFKISSGYRTQAHHDSLTRRGYPTAKRSAHLKGQAADILVSNSVQRAQIVSALMQAGFVRLGVGSSFIHCDNDEENKPAPCLWLYP